MRDESKQSNENILVLDVMKYVREIYALRKRFLKIGIIGAFVGLFLALSIPKQYAVSVTLLPEVHGERPGSGWASMAASFLGGSGNVGTDAVNPLLSPDIVQSTPFLLELLDSRVVNVKEGIDTTFTAYLNSESAPWWSYIAKAPKQLLRGVKSLFTEKKQGEGHAVQSNDILQLSEEQSGKLMFLRTKIMASVNKKTSFITLTVDLQDPIITTLVANSVVEKLQHYIIDYKIKKAKDDCEYWEALYHESKEKYYQKQQEYAAFVDANSDVISQRSMTERERYQNEMSLAYQVYTQVTQQLNMAQAKVQEAKPAFTIVEPAVVPIESYTAGKLKMMILFACLGVFVTLVWELLGTFVLERVKKTIKIEN